MGDGGIGLPKLSHIVGRNPRGGIQRDGVLSAALLHKNRATHSSREQQAPPRHEEWVQRTKKTSTIGMEKPPCELMEVPDSRRQDPFHTLDKKPLVASQRAAGSKDTPGLGNTNGENCREKESNDRNTAKRDRAARSCHKGNPQASGRRRCRKSPSGQHKKIAELAGKVVLVLGCSETETGWKRVVLKEKKKED